MGKLTLQTFITGPQDLETRQYQVLEGLRASYDEFAHSRLYPALSDLVEIHTVLTGILKKHRDIEGHLPHRLTGIDLEGNKLVFEPMADAHTDFSVSVELIEWALPKIQQAIEEGVNIYDFVEEHIAIEHVGIMPMYKEEGYWFVPEPRASLLHLLRYEVTLFTSANEQFRALKTSPLETIEHPHVRRSPESIKLRLIEKYRDLPNPATYMCEMDIEFPYTETLLPIAKRKLIAQVFS